MIEIRDLLAKWNTTLVSGEFKKESIRGAIRAVIGVDISTKDIEIKNNIIYLNLKPIYKSEIFLKKAELYSFLNTVLNQKNTPEIR